MVYMNGLRRFSCECSIYTSKNVFYFSAPPFTKDPQVNYWDLGYLDIKNLIFYETNVLSQCIFERTIYFHEWTSFLQVILDKRLFQKLFEVFNFNKGILSFKDRIIHEQAFLKSLKNILENSECTADFALFLSDMMKNEKRFVSYTLLRKKISSNLKNFIDNLRMSVSS